MNRKVLIGFLIVDVLGGALGVAAALLANNALIGTLVWFATCSLLGFPWLEYNVFLENKKKGKRNDEN